jgi:hypothetical protein
MKNMLQVIKYQKEKAANERNCSEITNGAQPCKRYTTLNFHSALLIAQRRNGTIVDQIVLTWNAVLWAEVMKGPDLLYRFTFNCIPPKTLYYKTLQTAHRTKAGPVRRQHWNRE